VRPAATGAFQYCWLPVAPAKPVIGTPLAITGIVSAVAALCVDCGQLTCALRRGDSYG